MFTSNLLQAVSVSLSAHVKNNRVFQTSSAAVVFNAEMFQLHVSLSIYLQFPLELPSDK